MMQRQPLVLFVVTEDWYFVSHRLALARALVEAGFRVIVATRVSDAQQTLRAHGVEVCALPFERALTAPWRDVMAMRALMRLLDRLQPDLVHLVALKPILWGGLSLLARRRPQRAVLAFTGLGFIFTSSSWLARALRPLVTCVVAAVARRSTHWILVQNDDDRALLDAAGIGDAARTQVIAGSGIDLADFPRRPLPPSRGAIVLLPARVLRDKGVHEFVAAARRVRATRADVRFVIAGERDAANPGAVAAADLARWQREGVVEWWQHCADMAGVYARARIVCLPSYREGLPKVLLEGASCGRPLIATNVPGCREVCRDGESGILVPAGDVAALSAAIHALLDDDALAERLARGARARVEQVFALPVIARATIVWYRTILAT